LYSVNLKLSVEAKITSSFLIFTYNQAKVGLIFHSALEKSVLSIDFVITSAGIFKLTSSLIVGIIGNSSAHKPFIFITSLPVETFKLLSFNNSIFTSSSCTRFI
jgi:hypothetical protein